MRVFDPHFGHVINVSAVEVSPDPDTQVAQVVGMMREYSRPDSETPALQRVAAAHDSGDPLQDVFQAVRGGIRFVQDDQTARPFTGWLRGPVVETLVRPVDMLSMRHPRGDCDDFAMTTAALLRAKGIDASFVTVAVDPDEPYRYSHVYVVAHCHNGACGPRFKDGERVALDTSHGPYLGWECPNPFGKRSEWPLDYDARRLIFAAVALLAVGGLAYLALKRLRR